MRKTNVHVISKGKWSSDVRKMVKLSSRDKIKFTEEMTRFSQTFLKTHFDMELGIPIVICGRLTRSGGTFRYYKNPRRPIEIKISERFIALALNDEEGVQAILDILKHELVHYALFVSGKQHRDGQKDFEETLARLNIGASGATNPDRILTQKRNVWYSIYDVYKHKQYTEPLKYSHTVQAKNWLGQRVGFEIVKTYF